MPDYVSAYPPKIRLIVPLLPTEEAKPLIAEELDVWRKKFVLPDQRMEGFLLQQSDESQITPFLEWKIYKLRHDLALAKMPAVVAYIRSMFKDGVSKLVCFSQYEDVVRGIAREFGVEAVTAILSETNNDDRQQAIDRFQENAGVKLFAGSTAAAGVGTILTAAANIIFSDIIWPPGETTQAEDRVCRIGQQKTVLVKHLVFNGSLDSQLARLVVEKQEIAERALDNTQREKKTHA